MIPQLRSLFRRRPPLTTEALLQTPLKRCLGVHHAAACGLAYMIGAGVVMGQLIAVTTGPAAFVCYFLAGLVNVFTALCYMELASLVPRAGSVYVFTFLTLGELPAFVVGWTMSFASVANIAVLAQSFSATVDVMLHGAISNWTEEHLGRLRTSPGSVIATTCDLPAAALILALTAVVASGARPSMTINAVFATATGLTLVVDSGACLAFGSMRSFSPENGGFAPEGFNGVVAGTAMACVSYVGYESIARISEEMRNPARDIPRAIAFVLVTCILVYTVACFSLAYYVPRQEMDVKSPFVAAFERHGITWLVVVSSTGTLLAFSASKISAIYVLPRSLYAVADDGFIFRCFARVEKQTQVPQMSLWFGAVVSASFALLFKYGPLLEFCTLGFLLCFFSSGVDLMALRYLLTTNDQMQTSSLLCEEEAAPCKEKQSPQEKSAHAMALRARFRWVGQRYPVVLQRRFFCWLLAAYLLTALLAAVVVDFAGGVVSAVVAVCGALTAVAWAAVTCGLSMYRPCVNRTYQVILRCEFEEFNPLMTWTSARNDGKRRREG